LPFISKFLSPRRRPLGLALVVFLVLAPLRLSRVFPSLSKLGLDLCYRLRPIAPPPPGLLILNPGIENRVSPATRRTGR
jgi:hypothetical protein